MFTAGREHERRSALTSVHNRAQAALILHVVDAVHDLLEGKASVEALLEPTRTAFVGGRAGVWEQASDWLRKSSCDYPQLNDLWLELAAHPAAIVRFRVARSLDGLPADILPRVAPRLLADKSKKVANMARQRMGACATP